MMNRVIGHILLTIGRFSYEFDSGSPDVDSSASISLSKQGYIRAVLTTLS